MEVGERQNIERVSWVAAGSKTQKTANPRDKCEIIIGHAANPSTGRLGATTGAWSSFTSRPRLKRDMASNF
jgi:hypothetical protein